MRPQAVALSAIALLATLACDPTVIIGTHHCPGASGEGGLDGSVAQWQSGFEEGFCDYGPPAGFCIATGAGSYSLVTSPVHSGTYAAAFSIDDAADAGPSQARCVEQGAFPTTAFYGAWYYVPEQAQNGGTWNLFHFQGGVPGQPLHGLWDVSLVNGNGSLHAVIFDFLDGTTTDSTAGPIPIGQWFHLEVYFRRSRTANGELTLWQDGAMAVDLTNLVTDDTDWGQWYVGNWADRLAPPMSTLYVDDVTVSSTR